jgi:hypothetical protein
MIGRLVSGGQTGVDRAALDAALELGVPCGGWCPKGRKAEDGTVPDRYPLTETPSGSYSQRTRWNIRDSDATLVLSWGKPTGGVLLTLNECRKVGKPHLVIDLACETDSAEAVRATRDWIAAKVGAGVLNVAGPRASKDPAVCERARTFLLAALGQRRLRGVRMCREPTTSSGGVTGQGGSGPVAESRPSLYADHGAAGRRRVRGKD